MDEPPSPDPAGPLPIRRLQESLINRIAAGEIIQRPSSALKELLENSLDAGATSIRITVKDGGLKLLQIQDNGCGIRKSDLPILAKRFTTSKISTFSDLSSLRTYGFRGEALASISHVSQLSVITKTKTDACAYKAHFLDGHLAPAKPGQNVDPKPYAGNDGTTIIAENLFYNTPIRLAALRSSSEEYARILEVVSKYAVHNSSVSFVCKKGDSAGPDISTPSNSTIKQAIRLLYGQTIARELLSSCFLSSSHSSDNSEAMNIGSSDSMEREGNWRGEALFTSANYHSKKTVFLLFINHRLVESSRMKRAIENVYSAILPKGIFPFVYLSLEIDPQAVDVNVHPTKREVYFLDEEPIIARVSDEIQHILADQSRSRTFEYQTQTLLTGDFLEASHSVKGKEKATSQGDAMDGDGNSEQSTLRPGVTVKQKAVYSKDKIRVSQSDRKLDSMLPLLDPATQMPASQLSSVKDGKEKYRIQDSSDGSVKPAIMSRSTRPQDISESECYLTSVNSLRSDLEKAQHAFLTEIVKKHVFVGIVDLRRSLSLVQHETKLYLLNHAAFAEELFYQIGLRQFGNYSRLKLEPSPPIRHLVRLAVRAEDERWKNRGLDLEVDEVVDRIVDKLLGNAAMLNEYFSMNITPEGTLTSLPLLLRGYTPDLARLPLFLMRLGPQVCWTQERECFGSFLRELAYFYRPGELAMSVGGKRESITDRDNPVEKTERWQIEHVLFPAVRKYLSAPRNLLDRDVLQVANLPDLYRVFERC